MFLPLQTAQSYFRVAKRNCFRFFLFRKEAMLSNDKSSNAKLLDHDEKCTRLAIALSQKAVENGNMPFGAVLADEDGTVLLQAHNMSAAATKRGGTGDVTRHAELELVKKICEAGISAEIRARSTLYTSTEPCVMCAGAIYWSQVGRVVYSCAVAHLEELSGPGGLDIPLTQIYKMGREGTRHIEVVGPLLSEEAMKVHKESGCWPGCNGTTTNSTAAEKTSAAGDNDIETEKSLFTSGLGAAEARDDSGVSVPVIDMSKGSDEDLADQFIAAANNVGFFTVIGHGIPLDLINKAFDASRQFFAQDLDCKNAQSPFASHLNSGYEYMAQVRPSTGTKDQKESLQITPRHGCMDNRWPTQPTDFRDVSETFLKETHQLAKRILNLLQSKARPDLEPGVIANSHNLWNDECQCTLRMLHYPPMDVETLAKLKTPDEDGRIHWRAGAHTDWCNITLLFQKEPGLECCSNPRDTSKERFWVPVKPMEGGIAVNIGDMLSRWSDGKLYSNLHRVRMPTIEECTPPSSRYSIAFFAQSDKSTMITSKDSAPITAGDYILSRIRSNFSK